MDKIFNASYKFTFGEISFQFDIDESLSLTQEKTNDFNQSDDKDFHDHPYYEIFFVFDNQMKIILENETKHYQNCIVCLPPNTKHYSFRATDFRILFSYNTKNRPKGDFEKFISNIFATNVIYQIPITNSALIEYLKQLCSLFYNQQNEIDREVIISLLKCILYSIYSLYANSEPLKQKNFYLNESRYIMINTLIKNCFSKESEVSLSTLADSLCLSKKQASRLIKKYYGKTLSEVIMEEKLNYSAYLLKNTNLSIYDVAFESNFHSYSYFCRCFTKKFGILPLQYKKENSTI